MTDQQYTNIKIGILDDIKQFDKGATRPYDTGNLVLNAIRSEDLSYGKFRIYVNSFGNHVPESQDGIAPYFKYVNYYDTIRGKVNKHYHWWDNAIAAAVKDVAQEWGGIVEESEN